MEDIQEDNIEEIIFVPLEEIYKPDIEDTLSNIEPRINCYTFLKSQENRLFSMPDIHRDNWRLKNETKFRYCLNYWEIVGGPYRFEDFGEQEDRKQKERDKLEKERIRKEALKYLEEHKEEIKQKELEEKARKKHEAVKEEIRKRNEAVKEEIRKRNEAAMEAEHERKIAEYKDNQEKWRKEHFDKIDKENAKKREAEEEKQRKSLVDKSQKLIRKEKKIEDVYYNMLNRVKNYAKVENPLPVIKPKNEALKKAHDRVLSKWEFERKEANKENVKSLDWRELIKIRAKEFNK